MTPKLSVVVVPLVGGACLERCLTALLHQKNVEGIEIIVPTDDRHQNTVAHEQVEYIKLEGILTYAELRAAGFHKAKGDIIALTEDQCIPNPDWCERILAEHSRNAAIGGAVDKGFNSSNQVDSGINWSVYFCDYIRYANPVKDGEVEHLTDCNVSYKRQALDSIDQFSKKEFHEPLVHGAFLAKGMKLWISSHIIVKQQRDLSFSYAFRERYSFGRLFGSTRVAGKPMSQRMVLAAVSLVLPLLLTVRIARNVFAKRRYRKEFLSCLLWIFLLNLVWSFGEFVGYLTSSPDDSQKPHGSA